MQRRKISNKHESDCEILYSSHEYKPKVKEERSVIEVEETESSCRKSTKKDSKWIAQRKKNKVELNRRLDILKLPLKLNKDCQKLLDEDIQKCKFLFKKSQELQAMIENMVKEEDALKNMRSKTPTNIKAISVFAAPYFRDVKRMHPPLNEDTIIKRKNRDVNAYLKPPRPWHRTENKKLLDGVTSFALLSALAPYKRRRDFLKDKLKDKNISDVDIEKVKIDLENIENDIKVVSAKPLSELMDKLEGKIDWLKISSINMEGLRSAEECECMWKNFLDFSINKDSFSEAEDEKLKKLAEEFNERNWDAIAQALQTCRTPIQCFERYQTHLNSNLKKSQWTPEEDQHLEELIGKYRVGKFVPWNKIALSMVGRTRQQIINRYERSLANIEVRGPWTVEEDAMLHGCVKKFGLQWNKMKPFFKQRSPFSMRERYVNALDPLIRYGYWTKMEDKVLIDLIKEYGYGRWAKICQHIPGRTDNMCLVRARILLDHSMLFHSMKHDGGCEVDVHDPELFTQILKPLAPTKPALKRSIKMQNERENASQLFIDVLKKVMPSLAAVQDTESIDFPSVSNEIYNRVSEILHKMLDEKGKIPLRQRKRKCESDGSAENIIDVLHQVSPVKSLSESEKVWLNKVLSYKFEMALKVMLPFQRRVPPAFNSRERAEMSLYKAYLNKQYQCSSLCDEEDDISNVTFSGIDYAETLQTVVSFFVQPPVYNDEFIVLVPNMTTLGAMEVMEATEAQLENMSELVRYSAPYMDFLDEKNNTPPKCLWCLHRTGTEISTKVAPAIMISDMKEKFLILDEKLERAAHVESASTEKSAEYCSCVELEKSRDAIRLLRKRFMSLFMWPALLSSTKINEIQENLLCAQASTQNYFARDRTFRSPRKRKSKRKRKLEPKQGNVLECKGIETDNSAGLLSEQQKSVDQPRSKHKRIKKNSTIVFSEIPDTLLSLNHQMPDTATKMSNEGPNPTNTASLDLMTVDPSSDVKLSDCTNVDNSDVASCSNYRSVQEKMPKHISKRKDWKSVVGCEIRRSRRACVRNKTSLSDKE